MVVVLIIVIVTIRSKVLRTDTYNRLFICHLIVCTTHFRSWLCFYQVKKAKRITYTDFLYLMMEAKLTSEMSCFDKKGDGESSLCVSVNNLTPLSQAGGKTNLVVQR
jgi:hypothetical protein